MSGELFELLALCLHPKKIRRKLRVWRDCHLAKKSGNIVDVSDGAFFDGMRITCRGSGNRVRDEKGNFCGLSIFCHGNNCNVVIGEGTCVNASRRHVTSLQVIGDSKQIIIGKNCLISDSVVMRTSDYHKVFGMNDGMLKNPDSDIIIGDNCWIGNKVTINKGVAIANNSIVGNCSVVTKRFDEQNVVIAGNPAQVKNRNVYWTY